MVTTRLNQPDQAAAEHRYQLGRPVEVVVADGQEVDPCRPLGFGGNHGARRIRAWIPARPFGVGDADAPADIDLLLANARVALTVGAKPHHQLVALDLAEIVEADWHLQLN